MLGFAGRVQRLQSYSGSDCWARWRSRFSEPKLEDTGSSESELHGGRASGEPGLKAPGGVAGAARRRVGWDFRVMNAGGLGFPSHALKANHKSC